MHACTVKGGEDFLPLLKEEDFSIPKVHQLIKISPSMSQLSPSCNDISKFLHCLITLGHKIFENCSRALNLA